MGCEAFATASPPWRIRATALAILLACCAFFGIASRLTPSPSGYGTHRQLGYPPCLMPLLTGHPCPTCGMTTAFAHAVRGQLLGAFHAQPAGLAIACGVFVCALWCVQVAATGNFDSRRFRIRPTAAAAGVLFILLFGWAYKFVTFHP